ncbi:pregnancy zone protein [Nephila pilipes]|uniref:Pregnancy zone protein n=1 Tax=Nephila pilipes TaxID=299642 RepID=A0A8X6QFI7_NEPPI|nr:pregnancy zone protein [Nephila pilipes]
MFFSPTELEITKEYTIPAACTWIALPTTVEDDDEAFDASFPEMWKISLPPFLFEPITTESLDSGEELFPTQTISTELTTDTNDLAVSTTTEKLTTGKSLDYTTVDQDDATVLITEETPTVSTYNDQTELADDANPSQSQRNVTHLGNFVNVDHDLDFPDGIEGNMPVSVLYFATTSSSVNYSEISKSTEIDSLNCPVCETQFPENFTDVYCNSAFALRVVVRDGKMGAVKILQEISYFLPQPKGMKKFAKLEYDTKCSCSQLQEKGSFHFILGTPTDLWSSEKEKHTIHLTRQVHVIATPHKSAQPEPLKRARRLCNNDP